jgi:uncharacterized protein YcgL (UPF0745 family)
LIGLLLYANKTSFSVTLADRKRYYSNDRKRAKDVVTASGYYYQAEKALHKVFSGYNLGNFRMKKKSRFS